MESQDTGLKAVIKNASTLVQETASKSEAAALEAVAARRGDIRRRANEVE